MVPLKTLFDNNVEDIVIFLGVLFLIISKRFPVVTKRNFLQVRKHN